MQSLRSSQPFDRRTPPCWPPSLLLCVLTSERLHGILWATGALLQPKHGVPSSLTPPPSPSHSPFPGGAEVRPQVLASPRLCCQSQTPSLTLGSSLQGSPPA